ncbi:MAG: hypothetical protein H0T48_01855 [Gemmatimonadaceae bacterium]|nr:hypothetical protein [Gemmatimonadaceae bacterium]
MARAGWFTRRRRSGVEPLLVRGNHDRHAGDPPPGLGIECVDALYRISPFILAHRPAGNAEGHSIAGHVHPGVRLYGAGGLRERLPCFVVTRDTTILPAIGDFTGLADLAVGADARVFAVVPDGVVEIVDRQPHIAGDA